MEATILSPSDFVALVNQTLDFAYPTVVIEGELSEFRVAKNRFIYFSLKDEESSVKFFGTVYMLPGPLEDGMMVRVVGFPRLHNRFGFSVNVRTLAPVGEGALKKAADLLAKKLQAEGLFAPERKRPLPFAPQRIGLITAAKSAAYADFNKILNERWGGAEILFVNTYVQGDQAPAQLVQAIDTLNQLPQIPDVIVVTRGGGGAEDLAAFNDERVVRAVSASRVPTLVAIGHEVDLSLAELAADARASTPTNAAQTVAPDRTQLIAELNERRQSLSQLVATLSNRQLDNLVAERLQLKKQITHLLEGEKAQLEAWRRLTVLFDPKAALKRGYAIVNKGSRHINRVSQVKVADKLSVQLADGKIGVNVEEVSRG